MKHPSRRLPEACRTIPRASQNGLGTAKGTLAGIGAVELATRSNSPIVQDLLSYDAPKKLPPAPLAQIYSRLRPLSNAPPRGLKSKCFYRAFLASGALNKYVFLRVLGVPGGLWGVPRRSCRFLGASGAIPGIFREILGALLVYFGIIFR